MLGVLIGFAIIGVVIAVGFVIGRIDLLGPHAGPVLSRISFFVLSPALLFTVMAEADLGTLFSSILPVSAIAAASVMLLFFLVARLVWRRLTPESVIGSLTSGYVNAGNIGIPVSTYVLGDTASSAPVILLQLLVFAPLALALLDMTTTGKVSVGRILLGPVRNPLIIASVLGFVVAATGLDLPDAVLEPFELVGAAAVPVILLAFGVSLAHQRVLAPGPERPDVILASVLKLVAMPGIALGVGLLWGLQGHDLFAVAMLAALPTAQNIFNYAQRYGRGETLARDGIFVTTVLSIVVMLALAAFLKA